MSVFGPSQVFCYPNVTQKFGWDNDKVELRIPKRT